MLLDHVRRVLDRIARLLIGARQLEDMSSKNVSHVVRPVRKETLDSASTGVRVKDCKFRGNPPPDSEMMSPPNSEK